MLSRLEVVEPLAAVLGDAFQEAAVPLWAAWPLPDGWVFTGLAWMGDGGPDSAAVCSWSGPDPFGDPAEMLLVSEEAGAGLGSYFAGRHDAYPGGDVGDGPAHARFVVQDRPLPLWVVDGCAADRSVYAGEAAGRWLWIVLHPAEASAIMVEPLSLVDARQLGAELAVLPLAEVSPRLVIV